ncbi:MAG TPA: N-acetylneuraminate synthase family protein [Thiobacillaceae bacterium]|nr:N-acetylneuraminate synthase family protein [Thiobacillaceae bacterium]HNU65136.1 N-acetylneuraminate synthase family protein [Thiobacillaceae bacterium]
MSVTLGNKRIGQGEPCFITFEAGPTHDGLDSALELVRQAGAAGADAIKFQMIDADRLVADRRQPFSYEVLLDRATGRRETIQEPLYDILKRRELKLEEWHQVKAAADAAGLAFLATVSFLEDLEFLTAVGAHSVKIASSDIDHLPLIRAAARTGMNVQLDTGNATLGEVETAVDAIVAEGNDNIIIHQCPSGYPARLPSIQLRMIQTLKQMFPFPIAFSDHTPGWEMDIAAVALGADLLEKTITRDRCTRSVEHIFSLEGAEQKAFIQAIRDLETALGAPRRVFSPAESQRRRAYRRSIFLAHARKAGERIEAGDLDFRRPGYGIPPTELDRVVGMTVSYDRNAGDMLQWTDLQP